MISRFHSSYPALLYAYELGTSTVTCNFVNLQTGLPFATGPNFIVYIPDYENSSAYEHHPTAALIENNVYM